MFEVVVGGWRVICSPDKLPDLYDQYVKNAAFVRSLDMDSADYEAVCFFAVYQPDSNTRSGWPEIVFSQKYKPAGYGFYPGACIVPDTSTLFLGAGEKITAYNLESVDQLWEEELAVGFWGWERYNDVIIMKAELELSAFDLRGGKLWSKFVEPPWTFSLKEDFLSLDVMGKKSRLDINSGLEIVE